jgi:hypothetical protein
MDDERLCDCGSCRYCDAFLSSEYDYDEGYECRACNGGGCHRCED